MIKKEDVFKIGQFAKPHGIKGEIALVTNSDVFDDSDDPYIICEMDGILVPFFIEEYRYKTDTVILLKLKNVDDEKAAREFSNREVFYSLDEVDRDDLVGDMTWDSFIGYRVIDEHHGEIGEITDVDESTINVRLSQLSAFAMLALFAFLLIAFTAFIIIKTPIRNYLPGYLDVEVRKEIMQNALRADSLERMIQIQSLYLNNVAGILSGTMPIDSIREIDSLARVNPDYEIPQTKEEKKFVKDFEEAEKYNLAVLDPNPVPTDGVFFYKPVDGVVSSHYNANIRHYGVDLVAAPKESVLATLDGTVVFAGFDPNSGNVIQVQHRNGFLSIYKHNELLLKEVGDRVVAGEAIALVGNTGKLSTGPHLHFELWYKGGPVNPEEYIAF